MILCSPFSVGPILHIEHIKESLDVHHNSHHPMQFSASSPAKKPHTLECVTTQRKLSIQLPSHKLYLCLWESGVYCPQ